MFNRNNVPNPFGASSPARGDNTRPPPRQNYSNPPPPGYQGSYGHDGRAGGYASLPSQHDRDTLMTDAYNEIRGYASSPMGRPTERQMPSRQGGGGGGGGGGDGRVWSLRPAKSPDNSYTYGNL